MNQEASQNPEQTPQHESSSPKQTMSWLRYLRPFVWLIPLCVAGYFVAIAAVDRLQESKQIAEAELEPRYTPQPVRVTRALQDTIQAWVFAEGTARS